MKIKLSGRTKDSIAAIQDLVSFLERFGDVRETRESIFAVDAREALLVAFSAQSYYERKGYYWFSLAKTKYTQMLRWNVQHAWMVLICGTHGRYFVPFSQIKSLLDRMPSNCMKAVKSRFRAQTEQCRHLILYAYESKGLNKL